MLPKGLILQQSAEHLVKKANSTHASPYQVYFAELGRLVVSVESRALESLPKLLKEWKIWLKKKYKRMMKLQLLNLATFFTWMESRSHVPLILRCWRQLGWTFCGSAYCQLIREVNKEKRLTWCQENLNADFSDVIWTDETTVLLENHRRFCHRKRGQKPRPKPRLIHCSIHVFSVNFTFSYA